MLQMVRTERVLLRGSLQEFSLLEMNFSKGGSKEVKEKAMKYLTNAEYQCYSQWGIFPSCRWEW